MYCRLQPLKNLPVTHPILSLVRAFLLNKCLRKIQGPAHHPHLLAGQLKRSLVCPPISMLHTKWSMIYFQQMKLCTVFATALKLHATTRRRKERKKFGHAWIFRRDLLNDATTGLWWLLLLDYWSWRVCVIGVLQIYTMSISQLLKWILKLWKSQSCHLLAKWFWYVIHTKSCMFYSDEYLIIPANIRTESVQK